MRLLAARLLAVRLLAVRLLAARLLAVRCNRHKIRSKKQAGDLLNGRVAASQAYVDGPKNTRASVRSAVNAADMAADSARLEHKHPLPCSLVEVEEVSAHPAQQTRPDCRRHVRKLRDCGGEPQQQRFWLVVREPRRQVRCPPCRPRLSAGRNCAGTCRPSTALQGQRTLQSRIFAQAVQQVAALRDSSRALARVRNQI